MMKNYLICAIGILYAVLMGWAGADHAGAEEIPVISSFVISDSEEDFARRIYSYDMSVGDDGTVHIVYIQPVDDHSARLMYAVRQGDQFVQSVVSEHALTGSLSTRIIVDDGGVVHVSYIGDDENLYYTTISGSSVALPVMVSPGAWHTRMQLDAAGRPVFIREGELWTVSPPVSRLVLVRSDGGGRSWSERYLDVDLPQGGNRFRLADFLLKNGIYHITFGDYNTTRMVLEGKGSSNLVEGIFHRFFYTVSSDGVHWQTSMVEGTPRLYEMEFWTDLVLDGDDPVIGLYQYAELDGLYNTGTSARVYEKTAAGWSSYLATPADYAATREGMGVGLVVRGRNDYMGIWDLSPDNTYDDDFRGQRGNIAIRFSGVDNAWTHKCQLAGFSAEGRVVSEIRNDRLYILALGDYVDAKLYFWEIGLEQLAGFGPSQTSEWNPSTGTLTLRGVDLDGSADPDQSSLFAIMQMEESTDDRVRFRLISADWDSVQHGGVYYPDTQQLQFSLVIGQQLFAVQMALEPVEQGAIYFIVTSVVEMSP